LLPPTTPERPAQLQGSGLSICAVTVDETDIWAQHHAEEAQNKGSENL
jgi:hypothetical protein